VTLRASRGEDKISMAEVSEAYCDWKEWNPAQFGVMRSFETAYFDSELAGIPLGKQARVLEIGFGNGGFLGYARARGLEVSGVEVNERLVELARSRGFAAEHYRVLADPGAGNRYDLIVAFDVLEHLTVDEIMQFFANVRRLLAPSGHFIARFPNGGSPFSLYNQHGDLTHKTAMSALAARQLAGLSGLALVTVRNQRAWLHERWPVATFRRLQRLLRLFAGIIISLMCFSRLEPMEPNLVAIWRKSTID
jgi:SAM-dependent methyltransferase